MEEFKRMILKVSDVEGAVATIPSTSDHTDGSWLVTDIYVGELFLNTTDNILQTRTDSGIVTLNNAGSDVNWGDILGTLSDQTDLQNALNEKINYSDYSPSHSLLVQQSGTGSPTSLSVGNETLVGRLSGGGSEITDLSIAEVKELLNFGTGTTNYVSKWIDSDTIGNSQIFDDGTSVGIGTTTPIRKLHVQSESNTIAVAKFHSDDPRNKSFIILSNPASPDDKIRIGSDDTNLVFSTNWTEKMRITSAGNVGIGTTSPSAKLEVNSGTTNTAAQFTSTDTGTTISLTDSIGKSNIEQNSNSLLLKSDPSNSVSDSDIKLQIDGSSKLTIKSDGNVGIGTTTPSAKLDVNGKIKANGLDIDATANNFITFITYTRTDLTQPASMIYDGSGGFQFNANGLIYSFTDNGGLGIGTTAPTEKLEVNGNIKADGSVQVGDNTDTANASNVGAMRYRTDGSGSYADMCMATDSTGTYEWVNIVTNTF